MSQVEGIIQEEGMIQGQIKGMDQGREMKVGVCLKESTRNVLYACVNHVKKLGRI